MVGVTVSTQASSLGSRIAQEMWIYEISIGGSNRNNLVHDGAAD